MSKYGALWQHLFRLRRVQLALEGAWASLQAMQHRKPEDGGPPRLPGGLRASLWQLRLEQQHFVNNMILYLSMDVIDASFGQLRAAIAAARDFSAADAAHRAYVDGLVSQVRQAARLAGAVRGRTGSLLGALPCPPTERTCRCRNHCCPPPAPALLPHRPSWTCAR